MANGLFHLKKFSSFLFKNRGQYNIYADLINDFLIKIDFLNDCKVVKKCDRKTSVLTPLLQTLTIVLH